MQCKTNRLYRMPCQPSQALGYCQEEHGYLFYIKHSLSSYFYGMVFQFHRKASKPLAVYKMSHQHDWHSSWNGLNNTSQCTSSHFYKINHQHLLSIKTGHLDDFSIPIRSLVFFITWGLAGAFCRDKGSPWLKEFIYHMWFVFSTTPFYHMLFFEDFYSLGILAHRNWEWFHGT